MRRCERAAAPCALMPEITRVDGRELRCYFPLQYVRNADARVA